jgi:hypothetical protein
MHKHSFPTVQLTRRRAAFRFRQLLAELQLLMGSFPDLQDAFDADELPLAFILKRDSHPTEPDERRRMRSSSRPKSSLSRQTTSSRTHHLAGRRKSMSDA